MYEERGWWSSKWWGPLFAAIFVGLALYLIIPNLPWIKHEIVENARVVAKENDSCVVETVSKWIVRINDCKGYNVGDNLIIKYKEHTSIGEISNAHI